MTTITTTQTIEDPEDPEDPLLQNQNIYQKFSNTYQFFINIENDLKYHQLDHEEDFNSNIAYGLLRLIIYEIFIKKIFLELFYNIIILKSFIHIFFIITFIFYIFLPETYTLPLYNRITSNI